MLSKIIVEAVITVLAVTEMIIDSFMDTETLPLDIVEDGKVFANIT